MTMLVFIVSLLGLMALGMPVAFALIPLHNSPHASEFISNLSVGPCARGDVVHDGR